jgi:hypothetical protein
MSEDDATTDSTRTEDESRPPVACTISENRATERADWMTDELLPAYAGYDEREDGVTVRFAGATETLQHVARFVAEEKECCSFADYQVEVTPPYDETRLTITGPEGTKEMFAEEFVGRLEGEKPLEPLG